MKTVKKSKPYVRIVEFPMFQRNVVVVHAHDIGELHDILYKNKDLVAIDRNIDEIWKDMQEVVEPRIHNSNGISFGINGDVYIFLREKSFQHFSARGSPRRRWNP